MGIRFRRSVRIAKGVRLNVSKSGVGISGGVKGARIGVGPRGAYRSLGIPGTGIYAFDYIGKKKQKSAGARPKQAVATVQKAPVPSEFSLPKYPAAILVLSLILLFLFPPLGVLGLIIYIITWVNLKKTPEYQGFQLVAAAEAALKKGLPQEAAQNYKAALELKPAAGSLYQRIADLYYDAEDFSQAVTAYHKYLQHNPNDHSVKPRYAIALAAEKRPEEAITVLQGLPSEMKEHVQIITMLGTFFLDAGQPETALNVLRQGPTRKRKLDDDLLLFFYTLGMAYKENGDDKRAAAQWQKVSAVDMNYLDVKEQLSVLDKL
ncbi:DUF4236 domain-containing protein [Dethiobacter alkaliphilus]|uniref:TPR repeat-containing protein n=1 Tax=Dethiobacter alkaliphilus AHT 1 TaxID=555088 RepID=C0GHT7_DETAL|nr:DUF4236 domain-containing protein [Dethiobacter alkaliphilus]EEG77011.1 TPR repeat-containing protein [Dethiobacter alkaliphilus AHT 1]